MTNDIDIINLIHKNKCEYSVLRYLNNWIQTENDRLILENCEFRSSLDLLRKFNDAKWHDDLIGALVGKEPIRKVY